jgi:hypothetical protein
MAVFKHSVTIFGSGSGFFTAPTGTGKSLPAVEWGGSLAVWPGGQG